MGGGDESGRRHHRGIVSRSDNGADESNAPVLDARGTRDPDGALVQTGAVSPSPALGDTQAALRLSAEAVLTPTDLDGLDADAALASIVHTARLITKATLSRVR